MRIGKFCLALAAVFATGTLHAFDRAKYDSIASHYKNQHAVYTNMTHKLVISMAEGDTGLVANSYVSMEKLFISDVALNTENFDYCFHSDFNQLTDINAVAYLPDGNNYKRMECNNFG